MILDDEQLLNWMHSLGIQEEDLIEKFILGSGRGGQNLQKTSSCVYLKHIPSGLEIKCQTQRSRDLNRKEARRLLCKALLAKKKKAQLEQQHLKEKKRRQKRERSSKGKEEALKTKKQRSLKKQLRLKPPED